MKYELFPWLILFLPLASAAFITLFTLRYKNLSSIISIGAVGVGFFLTCLFIHANGFNPEPANLKLAPEWLVIGNLHIDFNLQIDTLSLMMLLIVTGVGGLIHLYSYGYMDHDRSKARFFAFMSLFTFSMLGIVLSANFIQMFVFWELVGVSSYLLIGFWFEKPSAGDAAKKAFITNRLGDFGFLFGILMVWGLVGSLNFNELSDTLKAHPYLLGNLATTAALLLFCGAVGKSAQFPLHVWLADAMEGPTPVSALIHAATMVAAGVYMLCRIFFLLNIDALHVIAIVGGFTALLAALIAVQQNDIKRILAYSTLSQLGYMVMAVGLGGETPAMFHLTTHAFFKALLFLGAGSVIHALHEEQDIWKMGGLIKKMPITFWTFIIGTLALSGVPPFSGFFSKDSILGQALEVAKTNPGLGYTLFALAAFVAGLTTFYMLRLFFVAFLGEPRNETAKHAHEAPWVMYVPLIILAVLSLAGGVIGIAANYGAEFGGAEKLSFVGQLMEPLKNPLAMVGGIVMVFIGFALAYVFYWKGPATDPLPAKLGVIAKLMKNKFYWDEIYEAIFVRAHDIIAMIADGIDRILVEGLCIGLLRGGTDFTGRSLRRFQNGSLQTYAFLFVLGVAVLLYFALGK